MKQWRLLKPDLIFDRWKNIIKRQQGYSWISIPNNFVVNPMFIKRIISWCHKDAMYLSLNGDPILCLHKVSIIRLLKKEWILIALRDVWLKISIESPTPVFLCMDFNIWPLEFKDKPATATVSCQEVRDVFLSFNVDWARVRYFLRKTKYREYHPVIFKPLLVMFFFLIRRFYKCQQGLMKLL